MDKHPTSGLFFEDDGDLLVRCECQKCGARAEAKVADVADLCNMPFSEERISDEVRRANDVPLIKAAIAKLEGELATIAGEGLELWNGRDGDVRKAPAGGATLTVEWAVSDQSYCNWYPTTEAAMAALEALARAERRAVEGFSVDLTAPGCLDSRAYVTRYDNEERKDAELSSVVEFRDACQRWLAELNSGKGPVTLHSQAYREDVQSLLAATERLQCSMAGALGI